MAKRSIRKIRDTLYNPVSGITRRLGIGILIAITLGAMLADADRIFGLERSIFHEEAGYWIIACCLCIGLWLTFTGRRT